MAIPRTLWTVTFCNPDDPPIEWYINTTHEKRSEARTEIKRQRTMHPNFRFAIREFRREGGDRGK